MRAAGERNGELRARVCVTCTRRLQQLWQAEVNAKGLYCSSLGVVVARFTRSLLLWSLFLNAFNLVFTFVGPVSYAVTCSSNIFLLSSVT